MKTIELSKKEWELINTALENLFQGLNPYTQKTRQEAYILSAKLIRQGIVEEV